MLTPRHTAVSMLSLLLLSADMLSAHAQTNYAITNFAKTNNIYTNLNEQFPNTGIGIPGSGFGTPNQTFVFDPATYTSPNAVAGANKTTNGVTFTLASDAEGRDFSEVVGFPSHTLTIPVSIPDATSVHVLVNSYFMPTASFTFTGSGGATETFSGIQLHDFSIPGAPSDFSRTLNGSLQPNFFDQTAFQVLDRGAGGTGNSSDGGFGTYGIDEDSFVLSSDFAGQTLDSISIGAGGNNPIVLGVTVTGASPAATPEPSSIALFAASAFSGLVFMRRRHRARKMAERSGYSPNLVL